MMLRVAMLSGVEPSKLDGINIYPSPTTDFIMISNTAGHLIDIALYDLQGRLVLADQNITKLDVSHLPDGMYMLKITSGAQNNTLTERIVIR